jgi:hypothetical protein
LKIWVYFQAFKNSYLQERSGKHEKNLKQKVSVSEKNISASILKLDFGFGSRYQNLVHFYVAAVEGSAKVNCKKNLEIFDSKFNSMFA